LSRALPWLFVLFLLSGCSGLRYVAQSAHGHFDLMDRREPIDAILDDPSRDSSLKARLASVLEARAFASRELGLPDNGSYRQYVELDRPYATWVVHATPEFSLEARQWCFPIAGCVPYQGFFTERKAVERAQVLREEGLDVHVRGAAAYSTLGWFDDPILSTMFRYGEDKTAAIIFHELAHQTAYVAGDSTFNEAFASVVEEAGMRRWLLWHAPERLFSFQTALERKAAFLAWVGQLRSRLEALYASETDREDMRREKLHIIEEERRRGLAGGVPAGYVSWLEGGINNAALVSIAIYQERKPDFERLLSACGQDLPRFLGRVRAISRLSQEARQSALRQASCQAEAAAIAVSDRSR
jgi:predicted aminopeptidase